MAVERLSVVAPFFNEEEGVAEYRRRVAAVAEGWGGEVQLVCVDDGSKDRTLELLCEWQREDPRVVVVELSRNFGHQRAVLAGLDWADGDLVAVIDGDLQDPPEAILEMVKLVRERGAEVVYGVRKNRKESAAKRGAYWLAYRVMRGLLEMELPLDAGDFCLMRREVRDAMVGMREQSLFLRGLRAWVGFRQLPYAYDRDPRSTGESKYRWRDLFRLAYDGIFSFTAVPIRVLGVLGLMAVLFSACYLVFLVAMWLAGAPFPQGFTTLVLMLIFFSGVQLLALRVIGSYLYRVYNEVRGRPMYVLRGVHVGGGGGGGEGGGGAVGEGEGGRD
jgi:polyisoprenyl-phosphate glycosyltransferase